MEADTDDQILTANLGYGTSPGSDTTTVAMHLEMDVREYEIVGEPQQLSWLAFGVNGAGGDSWACFLRIEKLQ